MDTGYWMLDAGCWMLENSIKKIPLKAGQNLK
jgi:hypothetical protein